MPPRSASERVTEEATGDRQSKTTGGGDRDRGVRQASVISVHGSERACADTDIRTDAGRAGTVGSWPRRLPSRKSHSHPKLSPRARFDGLCHTRFVSD